VVTRPPPEADLTAFGIEVARLRQERGLTIEALAEATGVSRKTIINIENAHKGLRLSTAHALAHALGIPLADLVRQVCAAHPSE
jgi:transcriptional regulator with XRE-family HTH domain